MPADPLPNMTAQERAIWDQLKATNRGVADRAPLTNGTGSARNLIDQAQRAAADRANEGGR